MTNIVPTPQKNPISAPQQGVDNADVMNQMKGKSKPEPVQQAKERLLKIIKQVGLDPQKVIQAGKYAESALKRPEMYQMALDKAVKAGLLTPDQLPKGPGIDFQLLGNGLTAGRLTEELVKEGKL